jgi:hypothetical protein
MKVINGTCEKQNMVKIHVENEWRQSTKTIMKIKIVKILALKVKHMKIMTINQDNEIKIMRIKTIELKSWWSKLWIFDLKSWKHEHHGHQPRLWNWNHKDQNHDLATSKVDNMKIKPST